MMSYTRAEIRNGTGWTRSQRFIRADEPELLNLLGSALACIREGLHEDRRFRESVLADILEFYKQLGIPEEV